MCRVCVSSNSKRSKYKRVAHGAPATYNCQWNQIIFFCTIAFFFYSLLFTISFFLNCLQDLCEWVRCNKLQKITNSRISKHSITLNKTNGGACGRVYDCQRHWINLLNCTPKWTDIHDILCAFFFVIRILVLSNRRFNDDIIIIIITILIRISFIILLIE